MDAGPEQMDAAAAVRRVRRTLDDAGASLVGRRVLALCSGGVDSVVLVALLARLPRGAAPRELHVLWLDHGLRADPAAVASERAAARRVADAAEATWHERRADHDLATAPGGLEGAARTWRYDTAAHVAREARCDVLCTGHTASDQLEHALMTLVGVIGPGDGAPAAMPVLRRTPGTPVLVRPLLALPRATLVAVAHELDLDWVDDPTNADPDAHVRNAVRHRVVPPLLAAHPGAGPALARAAEREAVTRAAAPALADALLEAWAATDALDVRRVVCLPAPARTEFLAAWLRRAGLGRDLRARHVVAVERLALLPARAACARVDLPRGACARRDGYDLRITHAASPHGGSRP